MRMRLEGGPGCNAASITGTKFSPFLFTKDKCMQEKQPTEEKPSVIKKEDTANNVQRAHTEAEKDIAADAELSAHNPNDDLDEGETARLGDKKNDLGGRL